MNWTSVILLLILSCLSPLQAEARQIDAGTLSAAGPGPADHVLLFVLEGVDRDAATSGPMPTLSQLARQGATTWSAATLAGPGSLPAMASLLTGLPVEKHGITWDTFEFSRGYPRAPTVFDYLDLSGGRDSAIFFMDEALYQLARPEPYTDYQLCGALRPDCTPARLVTYINQYFRKATSGHGYGHAIPALPHLLVVHLPAPQRAGERFGWASGEFKQALGAVDSAMKSVLATFARHGLLEKTTVFVTSLHGRPQPDGPTSQPAMVPWIAAGKGIRPSHRISTPVSIIDTGATVMRTLGLTTHTEWDSRTIEEVFQAGSPLAPGQERTP